MKANELNVANNKTRTRSGRGISAGRGKTAGRGTKGQNSRAGGKRRPGFEGGQNPIFQRLPKKKGFRSYKPEVATLTTGQIATLGAKVDNTTLSEAGLIADPYVNVKVVVKGEITKKHTVALQGASEAAVKMIEKAGGSFSEAGRMQRPKTKKSE